MRSRESREDCRRRRGDEDEMLEAVDCDWSWMSEGDIPLSLSESDVEMPSATEYGELLDALGAGWNCDPRELKQSAEAVLRGASAMAALIECATGIRDFIDMMIIDKGNYSVLYDEDGCEVDSEPPSMKREWSEIHETRRKVAEIGALIYPALLEVVQNPEKLVHRNDDNIRGETLNHIACICERLGVSGVSEEERKAVMDDVFVCVLSLTDEDSRAEVLERLAARAAAETETDECGSEPVL